MRGLHVWVVAGITIAALVLLGNTPASALQFWLSKAGESTPVTTLVVAPNEEIDLSVWIDYESPIIAMQVMLGFDRATATGTAGSPMDLKIQGVSATPVNVPPGFITRVRTGGGRHGTAGAIRPYGWEILQQSTPPLYPTATPGVLEIAQVKLRNVALVYGDAPYEVVIWDSGVAGGGTSWTSGVMHLDQSVRFPLGGATGNAFTLTLVPVPEPGSLAALATGVMGLAGLVLRRRKA